MDNRERGLGRFAAFLRDLEAIMAGGPGEAQIVRDGGRLLRRLVAQDDWLPPAFAAAGPDRYRQNLLFCDPLERFSALAFVWGPGQSTPVHNHTVWGLVGVLRGSELTQAFRLEGGRPAPCGAVRRMRAGEVTGVSAAAQDLHRVANAYSDRPSISIHVYGGNIGRIQRLAYDDAGRPTPFVSGYSNEVMPNPWRGLDALAETA